MRHHIMGIEKLLLIRSSNSNLGVLIIKPEAIRYIKSNLRLYQMRPQSLCLILGKPIIPLKKINFKAVIGGLIIINVK